MKYFTMENWIGFQQDDFDETESDRLRKAYWDYWDDIKSQVPSRLKEFYEQYNLHDARLFRFKIEENSITARISVCHLENIEKESVSDELILKYRGLTSFESISDVTPGFNESLYGDVGYDEIEKLEEGYEHRWLFSTGIEFRIRFRDFDFQTAPST